MRLFASAQNRVLMAIGGFGLLAALVTGLSWTNIQRQDAHLGQGYERSEQFHDEIFRLSVNLRDQESAVRAYVLAGDDAELRHYRLTSELGRQLAVDLRHTAADVPGATEAVGRLLYLVETWRTEIADPAIATFVPGPQRQSFALTDALAREQFVIHRSIDRVAGVGVEYAAVLDDEYDALTIARNWTIVGGAAMSIIGALLSVWIFRRHSRFELRDSLVRRDALSAKRLAIVASLRTLRAQPTAEQTAQMICNALLELPGIAIASVLERTPNGLRPLVVASGHGFPSDLDGDLPEVRVREILEGTEAGPWAQLWLPRPDPTPYQALITELGVTSLAYAAIQSGDETIGIIVVGTADHDHARHHAEDLPAIAEFASVADAILAPALDARRERARTRDQIAAMIAGSTFRPVFQPVVDLRTGRMAGFEALTRFAAGSRPDTVFAAANACGLGAELESATLRLALRESARLPSGAWLSLNVSPSLLTDVERFRPVLGGTDRPIVLEVTEHEAIADYRAVTAAVKALGSGIRVAVDDAGAGVANFNHLVELRPDFVKIDIGLVRGVDHDAGRQAVVVGLVHFAVTAGAQVIAEGIETDLERSKLMELGVTLGQGYLLGRPAAVDSWPGLAAPVLLPPAIAVITPWTRQPAHLAIAARA